MEIKYNDHPITIKTIEINGKKMTKQLIQQIELQHYNFIDKTDKTYKLYELDYLNESQMEELKLSCNVIGWINLLFEKDDYVLSWVNLNNQYDKHYIKTILFINSNGELKRGYITASKFKIFCIDVFQIFI